MIYAMIGMALAIVLLDYLLILSHKDIKKWKERAKLAENMLSALARDRADCIV
jgi:D-alanyl-lipoteichoic acid acyltransferase DltB (MBOAT superfamily)